MAATMADKIPLDDFCFWACMCVIAGGLVVQVVF